MISVCISSCLHFRAVLALLFFGYLSVHTTGNSIFPANQWLCSTTEGVFVKRVCSCRSDCDQRPYLDCCEDWKNTCSTRHTYQNDQSPREQTKGNAQCVLAPGPKYSLYSRKKIWLVSRCLTESHQYNRKCTAPPEPETSGDTGRAWAILPVSVPSTGLTYANVYCGLCNGVTIDKMVIWTLEIYCMEYKSIADPRNNKSRLGYLIWFWEYSGKNTCEAHFKEQEDEREHQSIARRCFEEADITDACNGERTGNLCGKRSSENGTCHPTAALIETNPIETINVSSEVLSYEIHRGQNCLDYSNVKVRKDENCSIPESTLVSYETPGVHFPVRFAVELKIGWDELLPTLNLTQEKSICKSNHMLYQNQCLKILCRRGTKLRNNTCQPLYDRFDLGTVFVGLLFQSNTTGICFYSRSELLDVFQEALNSTWSVLRTTLGAGIQISTKLQNNDLDYFYNCSITVDIVLQHFGRVETYDEIFVKLESIFYKIFEKLKLALVGTKFRIKLLYIEDKDSPTAKRYEVPKMYRDDGTWVLVPVSYVAFHNDSRGDKYVTVRNRPGILDPKHLRILFTYAYIPFEVYFRMPSYDNIYDKPAVDYRAYVSLSLTIVSLTFLCLLFIGYVLSPKLREVTDLNTMNLIGCLFMTQLLFSIGLHSEFHQIRPICIAIAVLFHYFWFATMVWTSVSAFAIFQLLKKPDVTVGSVQKRTQTKRFALVAYIAPLALTIPCLILQLCECSPMTLNFGEANCLLAGPGALVAFFVVPNGVVLLTNFALCVSLVCVVRSTTKYRRSRARAIGYEALFWSGIQLSFTMTLTWVCEYLAEHLQSDIFWFVFCLLNCLQSVALALVNAGNERFLKFYFPKVQRK